MSEQDELLSLAKRIKANPTMTLNVLTLHIKEYAQAFHIEKNRENGKRYDGTAFDSPTSGHCVVEGEWRYEIHIVEVMCFDVPRTVKPAQKYTISDSQREIIETFASQRRDATMRIIYKLNDVEFTIEPHINIMGE